MRRWNGWGEESVEYSLGAENLDYLESLVGPSKGLPQIGLKEAVEQAEAQPSRLPAHPLVNTDPVERLRHATGQSLPDLIAIRSGQRLHFPDGVAYPTTGEEIRQILDYARQTETRLIPYGGGTSVVGHINPLPDGPAQLTVDLSRLNRLQSLDETSGLATFGAGVNGPDVEAQLRARGFTLGHFPQSFELSTLGGWIASRSSGQQSLYYGRIERLFAGGRVETPVGTLELPAFPASAAATDLREMVLGSEGRMGIISEATMRVTPLPEQETFLGMFFPDFERAMTAARQIAQSRLPLSLLRVSTALETSTSLNLSSHGRQKMLLEQVLKLAGAGPEKSLLLVGATGSRRQVELALKQAQEIGREHGAVRLGPIAAELGKQWRKSRFRLPYLRNNLWEKGYAVDTVETATNWSNVPALLSGLETALRHELNDEGERVHVFTHLSHLYPQGSSIYTTYLFRCGADAEATYRRWQRLKGAASRFIVAHGGTISHQHGVGADHAPYLEAEKGRLGLTAIRALQQTFDPAGLLNPGKTLPENEAAKAVI